MGQEEWDLINELRQPHESYPQLLTRALHALKHESVKPTPRPSK